MDKIIEFSHRLLTEKVNKEDTVIDATLGNGKDSLFLSQLASKVYSFDIQKEAIETSKQFLIKQSNIEYINDSHENVLSYVKEEVKAAIFNLGYRPGGDKNIFTHPNSTINAITNIIKLLKKKGIIVIVLYPGFVDGKKEADEVTSFLSTLNQNEFDVVEYRFINQINNPPYLLAIEKR